MSIAAAAALCACSGGNGTAPTVRSVYAVQPEILNNETVKTYSGIVEEAHAISLGFKTAGQIEKIHAKEGAYVREGQLLAELDDDDYQLGVDALQIQYDQLKDEVARTKRLFEQNSVSLNDYEKAKAGLDQLGVQLQVNKNKLDYTKLYAPTSGYIRSVNFSAAEMVDAGTAVFTLLDVSSMEVDVNIPASAYKQKDLFSGYACVANGQKVPMKFLSLTPKADGNQLYALRLAFERVPDGITAGMNVEVRIGVKDESAEGGFALPLACIFKDGEQECVWVISSDSCAVKRVVETAGIDSEGRARVVAGLDGNENIVRAGVHAIQDGDKVTVIQKSLTNIGDLL